MIRTKNYKWKPRFPSNNVDPKEAFYCLKEIKKERGTLTPEHVLESARDKKSVLHDLFDWSDTVAAEKWRKEQARKIIQSIVVVYESSNDSQPQAYMCRLFHSVKAKSTDDDKAGTLENVYEDIPTIRKNEDYKQQVIENAMRELVGWRNRYALYSDVFGDLFIKIDEVVEQTTVQGAGGQMRLAAKHS